mmetsp:Transcript_86423/g.186857  ORF Transcript_86423/g.186857 Transcript_86423/m.186857 type:complete len:217 (+) Transcript_86423:384-1034(+)
MGSSRLRVGDAALIMRPSGPTCCGELPTNRSGATGGFLQSIMGSVLRATASARTCAIRAVSMPMRHQMEARVQAVMAVFRAPARALTTSGCVRVSDHHCAPVLCQTHPAAMARREQNTRKLTNAWRGVRPVLSSSSSFASSLTLPPAVSTTRSSFARYVLPPMPRLTSAPSLHSGGTWAAGRRSATTFSSCICGEPGDRRPSGVQLQGVWYCIGSL